MNRYSVGISLVLFGWPIIFFIRDTLGLSPQNFFFTGIVMILFLLLLFNKRLLMPSFFSPNMCLFIPALIFIFWSITRMPFAGNIPIYKDVFYYGYLIVFFILLSKVNAIKIKRIYLPVILITLIDSLVFAYTFFSNFQNMIGSRIYVGATGNPNLSAFMAFYGVAASYICIKYEKGLLVYLLSAFNLTTSIIVFLFTRTRIVFIVLIFIFMGKLLINCLKGVLAFKFKSPHLKVNKKKIFIYFILLISVFLLLRLFNKEILLLYWNNLLVYLRGGINTILYGTGELSAQIRMLNFEFFKQQILSSPKAIIFGYGYKYAWLDIPLLQVLLDIGIIGFISILAFHLFAVIFIIKSRKHWKEKPYLEYFTYIYFLLAFLSITHGQPYDLSFWLPFAVLTRYLK